MDCLNLAGNPGLTASWNSNTGHQATDSCWEEAVRVRLAISHEGMSAASYLGMKCEAFSGLRLLQYLVALLDAATPAPACLARMEDTKPVALANEMFPARVLAIIVEDGGCSLLGSALKDQQPFVSPRSAKQLQITQ